MIRGCVQCGKPNRIPARHLADVGRCGSCQAQLNPLAEPVNADAVLFDEVTRESKVPVLVDFWASWCPPCRMVAPEVHALAGEMAGRAIVLKVDTQANPELSGRFGIRSIPNFMIWRNGQIVAQHAGAVTRSEMRRWLENEV
jgi:thioredoxin 2